MLDILKNNWSDAQIVDVSYQKGILLLALKDYDISHYLTQHKQYLKVWHRMALEKGLAESGETRRMEELDYLLSEED